MTIGKVKFSIGSRIAEKDICIIRCVQNLVRSLEYFPPKRSTFSSMISFVSVCS